jgi:hypothetical protein
VDFWRKPPPLIGFGVERHTLAHRRYHPGISPCYSGVSSAECAAQPVRAQVRLRVCGAARGPSSDCSFLPTQLRSSQGAQIEPFPSDSDGGIFQGASSSHLGRNSSGRTFEVADGASGQIWGNPSDPVPHLARRSF